jgi:hypothetical protein
VSIDVPICAVFLALYITSAALNLKIFIQNRRRGHKFLVTWVLFVLSMIRNITCSMRVAWATSPTNSHIAIAAQVFNNVGIIILYIVNMVLAQRLLRAKQPRIGWHPVFRVAFKAVCGLVVGSLIMGIVALVVSINTTNVHTLQAIRDVTLASATYVIFISVMPLVILALAYAVPSSPSQQEEFGTGGLTGKTLLVLLGSCLCVIIAGFKAGTTWETPRSAAHPAWYHSKAAFYCFGFMLEIVVLFLYIFSRVDKRFHVPDGCKGPGDYTRLSQRQSHEAQEKNRNSQGSHFDP